MWYQYHHPLCKGFYKRHFLFLLIKANAWRKVPGIRRRLWSWHAASQARVPSCIRSSFNLPSRHSVFSSHLHVRLTNTVFIFIKPAFRSFARGNLKCNHLQYRAPKSQKARPKMTKVGQCHGSQNSLVHQGVGLLCNFQRFTEDDRLALQPSIPLNNSTDGKHTLHSGVSRLRAQS